MSPVVRRAALLAEYTAATTTEPRKSADHVRRSGSVVQMQFAMNVTDTDRAINRPEVA